MNEMREMKETAQLRVAQVMINPTLGDLEGNCRLICEAVAEANRGGAELIVLPELCLCGYPPEDLLLRPSFLEKCQTALNELAVSVAGLGDATVVLGGPLAEEGNVYNAAFVLEAGSISQVYRKVELPNYGVFDERRYFAPGNKPLVIECRGLNLLVTICEDLWIEDGKCQSWARDENVDLVLNLSASPFHAGKFDQRREVLSGFAKRSKKGLLYSNLLGGQDELVFDGGAMFIDGRGQLLALARRFAEGLLLTDFQIGEKGLQISGPGEIHKPLPVLEEIHQALVLGVRDYVRKNGFEKVLLGLSGGIDSALTAVIAEEALGAENVIGVTMPSEFTSGETLSDAELLADNLKIELITIPIRELHHGYLQMLSAQLGAEPGIAGENIQARIRGNVLMAISNARGWLVLTTGNKSELAVGYCTLYGDMAGGFAVIKDLPKTLVWELSRWINKKSASDVIPQSTISRPPSAELRPDQRDDDSLPPYQELDAILKGYVEGDMSVAEIVKSGHDAPTVKRVVGLVDLAEYKRRQAPPGVKITPKAFGRDRRLPITNRFKA
jgi:NAD+ synthetase